MKNSQSAFLLALLSLCLSSCNIDEIPPEIVSDLRGWFTIESNNIGVNLAWSEVSDEDMDMLDGFVGNYLRFLNVSVAVTVDKPNTCEVHLYWNREWNRD